MFYPQKIVCILPSFPTKIFGISRVFCLSIVSRLKGLHLLTELLPSLQAEVWDLEVLRSNHSSWPINVSDVKEGLITVKGHMQVRVQGETGGKKPQILPTCCLFFCLLQFQPGCIILSHWVLKCDSVYVNSRAWISEIYCRNYFTNAFNFLQ